MTELLAFRPVTTAFEKTKRLLFEPFDAMLWIKLVIVMFFVGNGPGVSNPSNMLQYTTDRGDLGSLQSYDYGQLLSNTTLIAVILLLVLAIVALVLIFSYLRGVFSFVLIDALTTGQVGIVRSFKENTGRGFKVFLFNVATSLISLAVIGGTIAAIVLALLWTIGLRSSYSPSTPGLLAVILVVVAGVLFIVAFSVLMGLVVGLFYDFGVPLMYFEGLGLRRAIRRVAGLVRRQPLEFLVYIITRWVLEIAVSLVLGIVLLFILAISLGIGVILVIIAVAAAQVHVLLAVPVALIILAGIVLLILISAVIALPVNVYFRYYSLDFLQAVDPAAVKYTGRFA